MPTMILPPRILLVLLLCLAAWVPIFSCSAPSNNQNNQNNNQNANQNNNNQNNNNQNTNQNNTTTCTMPKVPDIAVDSKLDKFALTMFHYNIEYVVGGLSSSSRHGSFCGDACEGWDNRKVEDWIVTESFAPVVDFYEKHPTWKVNFEMQGYMLESIAQRYPALLEKLRVLTGRGQMEISSFHYSDQLFLAFPREDLERSIQHTQEIFRKYCIPLSPVVFNQEGQAGEGRQKVLVKQGYKIGVFPKNLFKYVRGETTTPWAYYSQFGGHLIVGPGDVDAASGVSVAWLFFDDGELLSVPNKLNPYFAPSIKHDPTTLDKYQKEIEGLESKGYRIAHISEYVEHLKARKVEAKPAPPLLDGTWQPKSTSSIHRWLGGQGISLDERDNEVRTGNIKARMRLKAAELLYLDNKKTYGADDSVEKRLAEGWLQVFRSQVSDASGVNPWSAEVYWSLDLNQSILTLADGLLAELKKKRNTPYVRVDLQDGAVKNIDQLPQVPALEKATLPLKDVVIEAPGRTFAMEVFRVTAGQEHYRIQIKFDKGTKEVDHRTLLVRFPRLAERIVYSPGLMEDESVDYPMSDFIFQTGEVYLPLPNGWIALGENWHVIKHVQFNHVAARIDANQKVIEFIDRTMAYNQTTTWQFDVFRGSVKDVLSIANRLNIYPVVIH